MALALIHLICRGHASSAYYPHTDIKACVKQASFSTQTFQQFKISLNIEDTSNSGTLPGQASATTERSLLSIPSP